MKRFRFISSILALGLIIAGTGFAATDTATHSVSIEIQEVALLALNNTTLVPLVSQNPAGGAGGEVEGDTDNTKQLYYTSVVATGTTRTISVYSDVAAPAGSTLSVTASPGSATNAGSTAGKIAIPVGVGLATDIITAIGSTATGAAAGAASLLYTLDVAATSSLETTAATTLVVTYTLEEDG